MLESLKSVARILFQDELRLRRGARGLRVSIEGPDAPRLSPQERAQRRADERRRRESENMQSDLANLLDTLPGARQSMRHLAAVERQLAASGLDFLLAMPLPQLTQALAEFEAAVVNWGPEGLACLRSKMAVAVQQRLQRDDEADEAHLPLPPGTEPGVEVREMHEQETATDEDCEQAAALLAAYGGLASLSTSPPNPQVDIALDERSR